MRAVTSRLPGASSRSARAAAAVAGRTAAERYDLKLYVAGATGRSLRAVANVNAICEGYLKGRFRLQIVDIYRKPELMGMDQIVAVPTLVRKLPAPARLLVGDLSRTEHVLKGLGLDLPSS